MSCVVCWDDEISAFKANCGHGWCIECLSNRFASCLKDQSLFPPRCCPSEPFPNYLLIGRQILAPVVFGEFDRKSVEYTTVNPLYCPRKTCSAFINVQRGIKCVRCELCKNEVCVDCRELWHLQLPCAEGEEERMLFDLAHENLWTVCPACKMMYELISGCNKLHCRCGQVFCYVCREKFIGRRSKHSEHCTCPCSDEFKAETQRQRTMVAEQEVVRLAEEAARLEVQRKREEEDARILEEARRLETLRGQQRREAFMLCKQRAVLAQMLKRLHPDARQRTNSRSGSASR